MDINQIKDKILHSRLAKDSFWALVGSLSVRGLSLLAAIVVARFLGKDSYGEYGMIRNTLISIAMFSTFGLGYTATKYVADYKVNKPEKLRFFCKNAVLITLIVSGVMALFLFVFSKYIATTILEAPNLDVSLKYVAAWVVFNALTTTQIGILSGFGEFKKMAKINTVVGVFTFVSSVGLTYFFGLEGALIALVLSQLLNWYLNHVVVKDYIPKKEHTEDNKMLLKEILLFSFPIALQEALYSATSWMSYLLLIKLTSYGELGLYSAAMQWSAVILFIPAILRNVVLSHMSQASDDTSKHNSILKQMLMINFVSTLIPFLIIYLLSDYITGFYGNTFKGLKEILNISVFTTIFVCLSNVYVQAYMSKGKNWLMLWLRFFRDSGIILLTFWLITNGYKENGAQMLAWSSLIMSGMFLAVIAMYYEIKL